MNSYRATPSAANEEWVLATADYGEPFVAAVQRGSVTATQFHPEKSGEAGLRVLRNFLEPESAHQAQEPAAASADPALPAVASLGTCIDSAIFASRLLEVGGRRFKRSHDEKDSRLRQKAETRT